MKNTDIEKMVVSKRDEQIAVVNEIKGIITGEKSIFLSKVSKKNY